MASRILLSQVNPSLDANGEVAPGSTLRFYENNTTNDQAVYATAALGGGASLTNPLTCDAAGRFPEIWVPDGVAYSVKWEVPGESPQTFNDIYGSGQSGTSRSANRIDPITTGVGVALKGVTNASSATAGDVGELLEATLLVGSAVNLTTNTITDIVSLALTPGDWDVEGLVSFSPSAGTNVSKFISALNTASATLPLSGTTARRELTYDSAGIVPNGAGTIDQAPGPIRVNVSSNTTVYLVARATFTVSSCGAYGHIRARRVR